MHGSLTVILHKQMQTDNAVSQVVAAIMNADAGLSGGACGAWRSDDMLSGGAKTKKGSKKGSAPALTVGSRAQVMHGTAKHTSGGLTKGDLKYNKTGRIVSKKKSAQAKRSGRVNSEAFLNRRGKAPTKRSANGRWMA